VHELGIAEEVYRGSRSAVATYAAARLERVRVAVGELTAIEPELLVFAWEAVTAGGPDAGAALEVERRPARQFCPTCRADRPRDAGVWLRRCEACGGALDVVGGLELDLLQVTFLADDGDDGDDGDGGGEPGREG